MRTLTYAQAIREAHAQLLARDPRVFVIGQGLWSPWYVGNSMRDLDKEFGRNRLLDCPVSESATTGAAIGAAIVGMRPIVVHPRMDFLLLAIDPIVNQAANWSYLFGGRMNVPIVIRPIINRGGEQGAQHSQAAHAMLAHIPGLKVVMPATAYDAKGLLIAASQDGNPVVFIEDRWLYSETGEVPDSFYSVPIGEAAVRKQGRDVTIVAVSWMVTQAICAAENLDRKGVSAEVIDVRTVKPLDRRTILASLRKTGRLVVADSGWASFGAASEIAALAAREGFEFLNAPVQTVTLPDIPAPTSASLEKAYYVGAAEIEAAVERAISVVSSRGIGTREV